MVIIVVILSVLLLYFLERVLYRKFWDKGLSIRIRFLDYSAHEGGTGTVEEQIVNRNYLPLPFLHAKFECGAGISFDNTENVSTSDRNYKNDIFSVLFYQKVTRRLSFRALKRGYYAVKSADLVGEDLFYTVHMVRSFPQDSDFYIFPKLIDTSAFDQPLKKLIGDMTAKTFLLPDPFEFRGIRDYTISDPMNTINWKASARSGALMVNQYNSTTTKRIVIFLNLEDETLIHHGPLHEESMRIAASLAERLLFEGYPVSVISNGRDCETREGFERFDLQSVSQVQEIFRMLARTDLRLEKQYYAELVREEMKQPDYAQAGYILISPSMKQELQDAFLDLSREAAALYVTPLYDNMESRIPEDPGFSYLRWEVKGHA